MKIIVASELTHTHVCTYISSYNIFLRTSNCRSFRLRRISEAGCRDGNSGFDTRRINNCNRYLKSNPHIVLSNLRSVQKAQLLHFLHFNINYLYVHVCCPVSVVRHHSNRVFMLYSSLKPSS
jgi:hypothetical protein